jgi:undecaprenyl pyrophosphate phosphatase UppP
MDRKGRLKLFLLTSREVEGYNSLVKTLICTNRINILGILQGLTELFLYQSGHLEIIPTVFGSQSRQPSLYFLLPRYTIALLVFFRKKVLRLIMAGFHFVFGKRDKDYKDDQRYCST